MWPQFLNSKMSWIFTACLAASLLGPSLGHNTMFEGYDLSLSGYHLCNETTTVNSSKVRSYKISYLEWSPCGGWLPWKMCQKTLYKTAYETVIVPVTMTTTRCCKGYEQVGSYCALPLNKSAVFTAKPGSCPEEVTRHYGQCKWDTNCSAGQKCCLDKGMSVCTDAKAEGGERGWCLNVTVVVKTNYTLLEVLPKAILNHTRLLQAIVTGALGSLDTSVYLVHCRPSGLYRTSTELLIGSTQPLPLQSTSAKLHLLLQHIEEVSHVDVQDVNECTRAELNSCSPNADCFNTEGSYNCSCRPGFEDLSPNATGQYCQDVNECTQAELNSCSLNTECINTEGSYNCSCRPGFVDLSSNGTGQYCQDVNECTQAELNNCSLNADCFNTEGSYNCSCRAGFVDLSSNATGQYCQDVNECSQAELNNCSPNAECFNTEGSYNCSCRAGFVDMCSNTTGQYCKDVNECTQAELNNCSLNADCFNTKGSYNCSCRAGFVDLCSNTTGRYCQDVNECSQAELNNCSPNAECFNTEGSYNCSCRAGFVDLCSNTTGQYCKDVNECTQAELNNCSLNADCFNTEGSYNCSCRPGFVDLSPNATGQYCQDVNECSQAELNNCSPNAECFNTEGSYNCSCRAGFVDMCSNTTGQYCKDVNECTQAELNNCSLNADCFNTEGSYNCSCRPGFVDLSPNATGQYCQVRENHTSDYGDQEQNSTSVPPDSRITWSAHGTNDDVASTAWTSMPATLPAITSSTPASPLVTMAPETTTPNMSTMSPVVVSAMQTLMVVARLTNVQFQEALLNTSSQEYISLTRSIEREILASLPPDIQELINSGAVKIVITSLSPGSVVVNCLVVLNQNVSQGAMNVSQAIMTSLQNSSVYTVDNNITIGDYDECGEMKNDCSPDANCTNIWGSYTCTCLAGFTDTNPDRPGRTCAALPVVWDSTTATTPNSTPLIRTTTSSITTSTNSSPSTSTSSSTSTSTTASLPRSPVSTTLAPITFLGRHASVECRASEISVKVEKTFLTRNSIAESSLYLGKLECNVSGRNDTHVLLSARWDQCGTVVQHNSTHNSAQITLFSNGTSGSLVPKARLEAPVVCKYWNSILISAGYSPLGYYLINDMIEGSGTFHVTVQLLNGTNPIPENYTLSPNEEVVVEVAINSTMEQIKLIINECWATPSSKPLDSTSYYFLEDSCPGSNNHTTVLENGISSASRLAIRVFSFIQQNVVYLHCKVQICFETSGMSCRPVCNGGKMQRTDRSRNILGSASASYGPVYRTMIWVNDGIMDSFQEVICIVVGVGIGVLILGVLSLVCYRKRRVGHYNFNFNMKPKQEAFTYNVFNT